MSEGKSLPRSALSPAAMQRFWQKVDVTPHCWEWRAGRHSAGYGRFSLSGQTYPAHRVSYVFHRGPVPPGLIVRHKCDNPPCVNPAHLELGTHQDNAQDRESRGRGKPPRGATHPHARLTDEQVRAIRAVPRYGRGVPELAREFGIAATYARSLRKRNTDKRRTA